MFFIFIAFTEIVDNICESQQEVKVLVEFALKLRMEMAHLYDIDGFEVSLDEWVEIIHTPHDL